MKRILIISRLVFLILVAAGANRAALVRATPASLSFIVNNSLFDIPDDDPGDGVCDVGIGSGTCTLRAAVMEANASPGADLITIPAGTYFLSLAANSPEDGARSGDLDLTDDITLLGAGEATTIIDGNRDQTHARVFQVFAGVNASLSHLTIRNGTNEPGPGITGGLLNHGTLTLDHVTLTDNEHGGLDNMGTATLENVAYTHNFGHSALLETSQGGSLTIINSLVANNTNDGSSSGAGIGTWRGSITLINTVVTGNHAIGHSNGGGIAVVNGSATLVNTTVSGNWANKDGGGIFVVTSGEGVSSTVKLYNVTLANNVADYDANGSGRGGGIFMYPGETHVTMANSLVANNRSGFIFSTPDDCSGTITSGGHNLLRTTTECGLVGDAASSVIGQDPLLGPLGDNGGPTWTHALEQFSPAIGAGNPAGCADDQALALTTDQRGFWRTATGLCDIGAYEYHAAPPEQLFLPLIQ